MKVENESLVDNFFQENFWYFVSDCVVNLKQKDLSYKQLVKDSEKILDDFPNLRKVTEDEELIELSKEEVGALLRYLDLIREINSAEKTELFLKGIREAYYFFRKTKIIKD